jgi:hypothetical protein
LKQVMYKCQLRMYKKTDAQHWWLMLCSVYTGQSRGSNHPGFGSGGTNIAKH